MLPPLELVTFANLTNDLVLHLQFDGNYLDSSGRNNNGTNVGATTLVAGKIGSQALSYNTDTGIPVLQLRDPGHPGGPAIRRHRQLLGGLLGEGAGRRAAWRLALLVQRAELGQ